MIARELIALLNETINKSIAMTEQSIIISKQHANNLTPEQLKELEKVQEISKKSKLDMENNKQKLHGINI